MSTRHAATGKPLLLNVPRFVQPDDVTCGPTCLAQVYRYFGFEKPLSEIIAQTPRNPDGGTLAVFLAIHALRSGFRAELYPLSLRVVDPTWSDLDRDGLVLKLEARLEATTRRKQQRAIRGHIEFLRLGGDIRFENLTGRLLRRILEGGHPVLTGLNATFLYGTPREIDNEYDDVRGDAAGHFVVIAGYDPGTDQFILRDPSSHSPFSPGGQYSVDADRLIAAILLGDITYDAVLLVVSPKNE